MDILQKLAEFKMKLIVDVYISSFQSCFLGCDCDNCIIKSAREVRPGLVSSLSLSVQSSQYNTKSGNRISTVGQVISQVFQC